MNTEKNGAGEKRAFVTRNNDTATKTPSKRQQMLRQNSMCYWAPPDGGWGWVVTFSTFMVGFILDGISFSFGIFFTELLDYFGESKSLTSWIISVLNGTYLGIGPVASVLVTRFGCRRVAIVGATMAAIGFFLCTLSPNVHVMILLYGLMGGAGLGLMYLPSIVIVGYYFKKKRALATGIAVCGSGIGGFVFAPLSEFLIEQYTWKGAMWIISAIVLNGVVVSALFRPIEPPRGSCARTVVIEAAPETANGRHVVGESQPITSEFTLENKNGDALKDGPVDNWNHNDDIQLKLLSKADIQAGECKPCLSIYNDETVTSQKQSLAEREKRDDVRTTECVSSLPSHEKDCETKLLQTEKAVSETCCEDDDDPPCCDVTSMFDFSLLKSVTFLVYGCSCFLCMLGFFIPFTYIPDLARDFGMSLREGAMIISIIGILNTVARVGVGWVADRPKADALIINSTALLIGGLSTMFVPFYSRFWILATYAVVFGASIAVFVSLRSVIMAELLGIEKLTSSFGLVVMCQGLSAFIGAPIAGALSDEAGDYRGAFYLAGGAIALAGVICFPLRRIALWEARSTAPDKPSDSNGLAFSSSSILDQELEVISTSNGSKPVIV